MSNCICLYNWSSRSKSSRMKHNHMMPVRLYLLHCNTGSPPGSGPQDAAGLYDDDRGALVKAKNEGDLHELLLDRRSKMKADRYCK